MLGWIRVDGIDGVTRDFYVRQLWDAKGSAMVETMDPRQMTMYAKVRSHSSAAHALPGDPIAIASYLGSSDAFDRALAVFAESRREPERARLRSAPTSGRERQGGGTDRHIGAASPASLRGWPARRSDAPLRLDATGADRFEERGGGPALSVRHSAGKLHDRSVERIALSEVAGNGRGLTRAGVGACQGGSARSA